jgi:hypothetical protein
LVRLEKRVCVGYERSSRLSLARTMMVVLV